MALDKKNLHKVLKKIEHNEDVVDLLWYYVSTFLNDVNALNEGERLKFLEQVIWDCVPELKGENLESFIFNPEVEFNFAGGVSFIITNDNGYRYIIVPDLEENVSHIPLVRAYDDPMFSELTPAFSRLVENPSTSRFLFIFLDARLLVEDNNNISSMDDWVSKFFELGLGCENVEVDSVKRWEDGSFTVHVKQPNAHGQMTSLFATDCGWVPVIGSNIDVYLSDNLPVVESRLKSLFNGKDVAEAFDSVHTLLNDGTLTTSLGLDCPNSLVEKISTSEAKLFLHFSTGVSLELDLDTKGARVVYCDECSPIWEA